MYREKTITELQEDLKDGKTTADELYAKATRLAHYFQEDYNSFVTILDDTKVRERDTLVGGIPYALKDNFSTSGNVNTYTGSVGTRAKDYSSGAYNYGGGSTIYTGPRGGQYYINSNGNKTYVPKRR